MNEETLIRTAHPREFKAIDALIEAAYAHDYGPSTGDSDLIHLAAARAKRFDVWVAHDAAGLLLGSVTTRRAGGPPLHEDVREGELDLRLLGVALEARRRGVASELMRFVGEHAAASGFSAVVLKTAPNMTGAHRLYEAIGFARDAGRDGLWIDGEWQFDLLTYVYEPVDVG
ncbi:N-acetyltransferase [Leucobacter coleopterorum]|uniref:N-acetyltransferase n=1 Tax=Leucobacter coleopterorum TaxID=2714933 RepID=A0ABX6JU70_9MICO|nr:GNAT family N-acetyltransferase [Leucobacter coleopterorum]QIM17830.1 N-acetyltransferase [Leucobacter coleopterorum]